MNWRQVDRYHLVSDCGRYTVAKVMLDQVTTYEAWRRGNPPTRLGWRPSAEEAKAIAERHGREAA